MDDVLGVRGRERVGQRVGDVEHPLDRHAALGNPAMSSAWPSMSCMVRKAHALGFFDREDRDDARMIERGQGLCLAAEALQAVGVRGHPGGGESEATSRPSLASVARYTSPIPPSLSLARTR